MSSDTATEAAHRVDDEAPRGLWPARLRRFGYAPPRPVTSRERLVPPYATGGTRLWQLLGASPAGALRMVRISAWAGPLLVALFAGLIRFWRLGSPHAVIFDETYYAKDAWSLLKQGYEGTWPDGANDKILADPQTIPLSDAPAYVVHPPVGKWIIALGEGLYGLDPFGWRFMTAVLGTLSVLMLCRIGRRLFRSTLLGCLAGGLMAVDGLHFVMSRTALLDLVVMFWVLAAFGAVLVDRDRFRARLAAALPPDGRPDAAVAQSFTMWWRPWLLVAAVCLGLAVGTKWNGLVFVAAFGLLTLLWDAAARRVAGARQPYLSTLLRDVPVALAGALVTVAAYLASWTGWFATSGGYHRQWAAERGGWAWTRALRSLWHYHHEVWNFHVGLDSAHRYESNPWSWLVAGRPVSYFWEGPKPGRDGCPAGLDQDCAREVLALGTPLLWWTGLAAIVYALYRWALRRDWRSGAILCGLAAGWLPWLRYQERTIFYFYAVVFVPFLCLAVAQLLGAMAGPPGSPERRRTVGVIAGGALVLLIVWNFVYFFPVYTGQTIPRDEWQDRMWFGTWI
ncbi:dolichyl-phosphate-mannose--protein mannosyltransferase [Streptomyces polyrhachis]|uniref:Polyprenol-phosphate-mannose--protein mannosyltransferase n=1 Tax=Streptomyces polyrhachis TaxID=1282885 RepID=A0ABW2GI39_9ACTN